VAAVYSLKGREWRKPLPVAAANLKQLEKLGLGFPGEARAVLDTLWPARLTAVLPLAKAVPAAVGGSTLAVRVPEHSQLCWLLEHLGPLTVTSANRSGEAPALTGDAVGQIFESVEGLAEESPQRDRVLLDAGSLPGGSPSTLVIWKGSGSGEIGPWDVLRRGAFDQRRLVSP